MKQSQGDCEASGKPTSFEGKENGMNGQKTDNRCRRYIRIEKASQWEMIDKLMTLPKYAKTFNGVIADALDCGLPILIETCFGSGEMLFEEQTEVKTVRRVDGVNEDYFSEVVKLLKEIILNETINKSILCSLFEAKNIELNGERVSGKNFREGKFRDTPDYLSKYELRALRDLQK